MCLHFRYQRFLLLLPLLMPTDHHDLSVVAAPPKYQPSPPPRQRQRLLNRWGVSSSSSSSEARRRHNHHRVDSSSSSFLGGLNHWIRKHTTTTHRPPVEADDSTFSFFRPLRRILLLDNKQRRNGSRRRRSTMNSDDDNSNDIIPLLSCLDDVMGLRCGASDLLIDPHHHQQQQQEKGSNKKQKQKKNKNKKGIKSSSSTDTRAVAAGQPGIFRLTPISSPSSATTSSSSTTPSLQVQALLKDRIIHWKIIVRLLFGSLIYYYVRQCIQTAGIPRKQSIWRLLNKASLLSSSTSTSTTAISTSFQPTPLDTFLAETIARSNRDMIPPSSMPSALPLIGAIVSCLMWMLFTVLLPHWFVPFRVWYDYHQLPPTPLEEEEEEEEEEAIKDGNDDDSNTNDEPLVKIQKKGWRRRRMMPPTAVLVKVDQSLSSSSRRNNNSNAVVCNLHPTSICSQTITAENRSMPPYYFEHNHRRYYYDPKSDQCWDGGPNLSSLTIAELTSTARTTTKTVAVAASSTKKNNDESSDLDDDQQQQQYRGLLHSPSRLVHAKDRWLSYNHQTTVPIPTMRQALWERLKSPLVVIQLIGKTVAVLEDGKAALIALGQTIFQHYHNANSMIRSSKTLQQDVAGLATEFATQLVWIYRVDDGEAAGSGGWKLMEASNLLPGDLFLLTSSSSSSARNDVKASTTKKESPSRSSNEIVPVDALVLEGLCVTMEAVLTGESVPQTKMPFDCTMPEWQEKLDIMGMHRSAVVFAGTTILQCMPGTEVTSELPQENGVLCLALRTGSYSSKGELINALTASGARSGVSTISNAQFDLDSLRMIAVMSILSTLACVSLFVKPSGLHQKVSGFRRLIQCTRIAAACIPSDLPLSLSYVVQSCANVLRQEADVVCAQPGALLTSSEIDTVVFDKTGTLTADTQSLSKVIFYPEKVGSNQQPGNAESASQQSTSFQLVLAGCHSLVNLDENKEQSSLHEDQPSSSLVGDPLELAALNWVGWRYNPQGGYFHPPTNQKDGLGGSKGVEKVWQLKVFPFSPKARLSSALCLAQHANGEYKLWTLVKGAPEAVQRLLALEEGDQSSQFETWYKRRVKKLESKGFRTLATASGEVQPSDNFIFEGSSSESEILAKARSYAASVHRTDLESPNALASFCGLACFEAKVRPSSERIVHELEGGNVRSVMLTGDSMGAAVAVAKEVCILKERSDLAVLEKGVSLGSGLRVAKLQWRLLSSSAQTEKILRFNKKTINAILKKNKRGDLAIASTGDALMALLEKRKNLASCKPLVNSLTIVSRASPECKELFLGLLSHGDRKVLMCGDGVNDVSAMKEADVSVALLNGFGTELLQSSENGKTDIHDERRKQKLQNKRADKQVKKGDSFFDGAKTGLLGKETSSSAAMVRIQQRIEAAQEKITQRALERQGKKNVTSSEPIPYTLSDVKDMFSSALSAAMEERRRAKKLREGGGEAANILLEDDLVMGGGDATSSSLAKVRPGEACMASPFSCLRSSIDGVEAVLRAGVATAACTISVQQKMALNLLMTCFNLSALYRDGFRYGSNMASVEFLLYMIVEQVSFRESCKMRPRLPTTKQRICHSLFETSSLISVLSQTAVHLVLMQVGIVFARNVETQPQSASAAQAKPLIQAARSQSPKLAAILGALIKNNSNASEENKKDKVRNFLGQPKFVPNYESNVVFILSLFQSTLTTLLMHKGAPFYVGILESPQLCLWSGLSIVFAVGCILETFPVLNSKLELRPWIVQRHKVFVLALAVFDSFACSAIEWYCRWRSKQSNATVGRIDALKGNKQTKRKSHRRGAKTAADLEEQVLREESRKNAKMVLVFVGVVGTMAFDALLKAWLRDYQEI